MILDNKIWFRNYQIVYDANDNKKDNTLINPVLVEIGPRFVLDPIRIMRSSFHGSTIYQNENYINPNAQRRAVKRQKQLLSVTAARKGKGKGGEKNPYMNKVISRILKSQKKKEMKKIDLDPEQLEMVFDKGSNFGFENILVNKKIEQLNGRSKLKLKSKQSQSNSNINSNSNSTDSNSDYADSKEIEGI